MEKYVCKVCGAEAKVEKDGTIIRFCEHKSTILLDMSVTVTGEGSTNT